MSMQRRGPKSIKVFRFANPQLNWTSVADTKLAVKLFMHHIQPTCLFILTFIKVGVEMAQ